MSETVRLQAYLARCGVASRRHCEEYILQGRVTVNGQRAELGCKVSPGDRVCLDRKVVKPEEQGVYIAVNKPRGYLCANEDAEGRPLVSHLLRRIPYRLFHVGRLDYQSSGLIFYTNDGRFARQVSHPSATVEKEYVVQCSREVPEELLQRYQKGVRVDGVSYRLKSYRFKAAKIVVLTLVEGKNREIRRVFEHFRLPLKAIHRVRIGCVTDRDIPLGKYRRLTPTEIQWFLRRSRG